MIKHSENLTDTLLLLSPSPPTLMSAPAGCVTAHRFPPLGPWVCGTRCGLTVLSEGMLWRRQVGTDRSSGAERRTHTQTHTSSSHQSHLCPPDTRAQLAPQPVLHTRCYTADFTRNARIQTPRAASLPPWPSRTPSAQAVISSWLRSER